MTATASPMTTPYRSRAQRLEALAKANDRRIRRAQLKRDIRAGRKSPLEVLEAPPDYAELMKVRDLLLAVPGAGPVKIRRVLVLSNVAESKTVGGLTERARRELCVHVRADLPPYEGRTAKLRV